MTVYNDQEEETIVEDADSDEEKNSDAEQEEEADDDEGESDDEDSKEDEEESDDSDEKPVTMKQLKDFFAANAKKNSTEASRRISSKKNRDSTNKNLAPQTDPNITKRLDTLEVSEKKREFGFANGLSPAETDHIFRLNPNPTKKFLKEAFVQGGLAELRRRSNLTSNIPNGSAHSVPVKGSKTFSELSKEEKSQNFGALQRSILNNRRK